MSVMSGEPKDEVREMLSPDQVLECIPISKSMLVRLEKDGLFPQSYLVGPHRRLYFKDQVVRWQRELQNPQSELSKAVHQRASILAQVKAVQMRDRRKKKDE